MSWEDLEDENEEYLEDDFEDEEDENDPLVQRLRQLKWPEVPAEVRERCWREFQERIARKERGEPEPEKFSSRKRLIFRSY